MAEVWRLPDRLPEPLEFSRCSQPGACRLAQSLKMGRFNAEQGGNAQHLFLQCRVADVTELEFDRVDVGVAAQARRGLDLLASLCHRITEDQRGLFR